MSWDNFLFLQEVNHPASGITSFTYDALGNVLTKQTANLAKEGKFITYDYDYQRLTGINYPDHPENNVKYYYGGRNASQNRIGRLMLREDGTGAVEYFCGKMGEVTKTRRTMIVPNQAIATYVTQWTYDSHNRLQEMIYPDEEKITYSYNLGGQIEKVHGYKSYGYDYVSKIGYDKFEQRTYLKYCNGAETFYTYDPQRRRLQNLTVNSSGNTIMDNAYTYDAVSNVLSVVNGASVPQSGKAGGQMAHTYTYDALYRLVSATGTYTGADSKTASYTLAMGYDNMHRITSKRQILTQNNVQFDGTLNTGYDLTYTYGTDAGKKFQIANVKDVNYRTEETPSESENVNNNHAYEYDANGNLVYVNTSRTKKDGMSDEKTAERKLKWDEENRLLASDDNGFVTNYWYDADRSLRWRDAADITMSAAFGAASGIIDNGVSRMTKWIVNPRNRKIITKLLDVGIDMIEDALKQYIGEGDISISSMLVGTLTEVGMGNLIGEKYIKKTLGEANKAVSIAERRLSDLSKRRNPNAKLMRKAQEELNSAKKFLNLIQSIDVGSETAKKQFPKAFQISLISI